MYSRNSLSHNLRRKHGKRDHGFEGVRKYIHAACRFAYKTVANFIRCIFKITSPVNL
jgi:hypothetical protein